MLLFICAVFLFSSFFFCVLEEYVDMCLRCAWPFLCVCVCLCAEEVRCVHNCQLMSSFLCSISIFRKATRYTHPIVHTFFTARTQGQQVNTFPQCLGYSSVLCLCTFRCCFMCVQVTYRYVQMVCAGFFSTFIKNSCQQMSNLPCCWHLNTPALFWTKSYKSHFRDASENGVNALRFKEQCLEKWI